MDEEYDMHWKIQLLTVIHTYSLTYFVSSSLQSLLHKCLGDELSQSLQLFLFHNKD